MRPFDSSQQLKMSFSADPPSRPLADRIRPVILEEFQGQKHLLAPGRVLHMITEKKEIGSLILWGPPGTGKTTLAFLLAKEISAHFIAFSGVMFGLKEFREALEEATRQRDLYSRKTILFVDEIHRLNKAQQDAFLPYVENGTIVFIGATTENPSFEIISALLSRCQVLLLYHLQEQELIMIMERALREEKGLGQLHLEIEPTALDYIAKYADGDARVALNTLELAALLTSKNPTAKRIISVEMAKEAMQKRLLKYDKGAEEHYNLISALHKSLRGSDPDAAVYWLERMLGAGEDPIYIARRMIRFASEDIGNADSQALIIAVAALQAFQCIGMPEGKLALAQAAVYLATAPKSNALYSAYQKVEDIISETKSLPVPLHIRNAPTTLMKELNYGKGYKYAHDYEDAHVPQEYLPERLRGKRFYEPTERGFEREIGERMKKWRKLKQEGK